MDNKTGFAAVPVQPKEKVGSLDPDATRYGVTALWPVATTAQDFYTWTIPANTVFPFRTFVSQRIQNHKGEVIHVVERKPADQIADLVGTNKYFVELTALAKLGDEGKAVKVAEILSNPNPCGKYGLEIGNSCTSCWLQYLHTEAESRIKEVFSGDNELARAANKSVLELRGALTLAIDEARRQIDEEVRAVDDPRSGKTAFSKHDYNNVYHVHAERPQYRTTTNANASIDRLAEILSAQAKPAASSVDPSMIEALLAKIQGLEDKLAEKDEAPAKKKAAAKEEDK